MDLADRGGEVLATGDERAQGPRHRGPAGTVVDGLKGFPEAITSVYPECIVQTCIVHLIRYSLQFASWKERKPLAKALKVIYLALRNITAKWKNPPREWHAAKAQFAIQFGDRFVLTV